jgi:hypothetical protein
MDLALLYTKGDVLIGLDTAGKRLGYILELHSVQSYYTPAFRLIIIKYSEVDNFTLLGGHLFNPAGIHQQSHNKKKRRKRAVEMLSLAVI